MNVLNNDFPDEFRTLKELDSGLKCGICFEYMNTTLMLPKCSHNYCSLCIRSYCRYKLLCPTCSEPFSETDLISNRCLDKIISLFSTVKDKLISKLCFNLDESTKSHFVEDSIKMNDDNDIFNQSTDSEDNFIVKTKIINNSICQNLVEKPTHKNGTILPTTALETKRNIHSTKSKEESNKYDKLESSTDVLSASKKAILSKVNKVDCPVCGVLIPSTNINVHLDKCLQRKEGANQDCIVIGSSVKRKPLPKLVYALLSEKDLRKKLADIGLPTIGDKQKLVKRHQEYVLLYNSQCDSLNPKPVGEIVKMVIQNENLKSNSINTSPVQILKIDKSTSNEEADALKKNYITKHKTQFSDLIAAAKKSRDINKLEKTLPVTTFDTATITNHSAIFDSKMSNLESKKLQTSSNSEFLSNKPNLEIKHLQNSQIEITDNSKSDLNYNSLNSKSVHPFLASMSLFNEFDDAIKTVDEICATQNNESCLTAQLDGNSTNSETNHLNKKFEKCVKAKGISSANESKTNQLSLGKSDQNLKMDKISIVESGASNVTLADHPVPNLNKLISDIEDIVLMSDCHTNTSQHNLDNKSLIANCKLKCDSFNQLDSISNGMTDKSLNDAFKLDEYDKDSIKCSQISRVCNEENDTSFKHCLKAENTPCKKEINLEELTPTALLDIIGTNMVCQVNTLQDNDKTFLEDKSSFVNQGNSIYRSLKLGEKGDVVIDIKKSDRDNYSNLELLDFELFDDLNIEGSSQILNCDHSLTNNDSNLSSQDGHYKNINILSCPDTSSVNLKESFVNLSKLNDTCYSTKYSKDTTTKEKTSPYLQQSKDSTFELPCKISNFEASTSPVDLSEDLSQEDVKTSPVFDKKLTNILKLTTTLKSNNVSADADTSDDDFFNDFYKSPKSNTKTKLVNDLHATNSFIKSQISTSPIKKKRPKNKDVLIEVDKPIRCSLRSKKRKTQPDIEENKIIKTDTNLKKCKTLK